MVTKKAAPKTQKAKPEPKPQPAAQAKTARASIKFLRIAPRKMRLVIDTIRHKPAFRALDILASMPRKAARMTAKLLTTAVANAKVLGMDEGKLVVSRVYADGGPAMKRFMARSQGRADRILKRTTHLAIELQEGVKRWDVPHAEAAQAEETKTEKTAKGGKKKSAKAGA